jgi:hypothetical protein
VSKNSSDLSLSYHISLACLDLSIPLNLSFFELKYFGEFEAFKWWNLWEESIIQFWEPSKQSIVNLGACSFQDMKIYVCSILSKNWVGHNFDLMHIPIEVLSVCL